MRHLRALAAHIDANKVASVEDLCRIIQEMTIMEGTGPVDAVCQAVNKIVGDASDGDTGELVEFAIDAVTEGINAVGAITMRVAGRDRRRPVYSGYGVDTDIIVASASAYVAALNKLLHARSELGVALSC